MNKLLSCFLAVCVLLTAFTIMPSGIGATANTDEAAKTTLSDNRYSASSNTAPGGDTQTPSSVIPDESGHPASGLSPTGYMLSALPDSKYLDSLTDNIENMKRYYENKYQDSFEGEPFEVRAYYSEKYANEFERLLELYRETERRFPEPSSNDIFDNVSAGNISDLDTEDSDIAATGASDLSYDLTNGVLTVYASGEWFSGKQPPWRSRRDEIREVFIKPGTTMINQYAFYAHKNLSKVTIPSSVTSIDEAAFYECSSLTQITLPDNLEAIGYSVFRGCTSLKSITIPDSVKKLDRAAFYGCSALVSAVIGGSVEEMGEHAFRNCSSLERVTLNYGVGSIGQSAFNGCTSLSEIAIPSSVTALGGNVFRGCSALRKVTLDYGIDSIGECAFYECTSLSDIYIPSSVTSIGRFAFNDCSSLTSITIPDSVVEMGTFVFQTCDALESVVLPINMKVIPSSTFANCEKLTYVRLPGNLETISSSAFANAQAYRANIPSTVKVIESRAYEYTSSNGTVTIPDSVERIEKYAFSHIDGLKKVSIGSGLSVIGDNPFRENDDLAEITISSSNPFFSSIDGAMYDKNMVLIAYPPARTASTVVIPNGVTEIGAYAFCHAYNIRNLTLPDSVVSIGDNAFESSTYLSGKKLISKNSFDSFVFSKNLKEIGSRAFWDCGFTSLDLPDSLNRIGDEAFCSILPDSVTIPKNVDSIGVAPFWLSTNLSNINVASANPYYKSVNGAILTKDGKMLVTMPYNKTSYTIPNGVEEIAREAFDNTKLKSVTFPDTLRVIGLAAFGGTDLSGDITIPDSVSKIDKSAFSLCKELTGITLGKGLSYLGGSAFFSCDKLKSVRFRGNAPELEEGSVFAWYPAYSQFVSSTVTAYYPQNDSSWNEVITYDFGDTVTWKPWDSTVVEKINIASCDISLDSKPLVYDGTAKQPSVTVKYQGAECLTGIDFNLKYENYINAGTASVTVTGVGRYTGSKTLNYSIRKASQTVTASLTPNELKVGDSAAIKASGKGTLSYSVSPSGIAEVNSAGLVTAKKPGSAVITIKAAGDSNYSSDETQVNVTVTEKTPVVKPPTIDDVTFGFTNSSSAFGYPSDYRIPLDSYRVIHSEARSQQLYDSHTSWNGNCYGFSMASSLFTVPDSGLSINSFRYGATAIKQLKATDYSSSYGFNVTRLLEALLSVQWDSDIMTIENSHVNKCDALLKEVEKCNYGAPPIGIGFRGYGGHEITGYGLIKSGSVAKVKVYNNWYVGKEEYMEFKLDSNGKATGEWTYPDNGYSSRTHRIDYTTYDDWAKVWANRRSAKNVSNSLLMINSDNFVLRGSDGKTVAEMIDGTFTGYSDDVFEHPGKDFESDKHILYVPSDSYTVSADDVTPLHELDVALVNQDQSVQVNTESDTVTLVADDVQALSIATVDGNEGEYYEVNVNSSMDYSKDKEEMVYRGKSDGYEVTVGSSYGEDFSYQYTRSGYLVNSDAYNTGAGKNTVNISGCEITLDKTSVDYTGEPVYPQVTVVYNGMTLTQNIDYIVAYIPSGSDGATQATVYGINNYTGVASADYTVNKLDISSGKIDLGASSFPLSGGDVKPVPTLTVNGVILSNNTDYTVTYENNTAVGTATVILRGINDCTGTVSATFDIVDYEAKPLAGDVNEDSKVNALDRIMLTRYINQPSQYQTRINLKNADVNNDDTVNAKDRAILTRYVARWKGYTSLPYDPDV